MSFFYSKIKSVHFMRKRSGPGRRLYIYLEEKKKGSFGYLGYVEVVTRVFHLYFRGLYVPKS